MKNTFQPPFSEKTKETTKKKPSATVAVGLKSSATAVELRPSVQHWQYDIKYTPEF